MLNKRHSLLRVSLYGFVLTLLLNLVINGFFEVPSAVFFSTQWSYLWLPAYAAWLVFAAIGFIKVFIKELAELVDEFQGH